MGKLNRVNIQIYKRERKLEPEREMWERKLERERDRKQERERTMRERDGERQKERWRERERQSERGVDLLGGGMRGGAWLTLGGGGRNGGGGMFGGRGPGGKKGGILLGFGSASDDECSEIT